MYLDKFFAPPHKQRGVSMAFLLFTMIIVSLLAAALMRLNAQSNISNAHQVISTRAFFTAESGAQLQAMAIFPSGGGGVCASPAPYNFNVPGLSGCTATTSCQSRTIGPRVFYQVISVGQCNSGQLLQATRTIEVRLSELN